MLPVYAYLVGSGAGAPVPTLTSVSTAGGAVGDIDGGYSATLTGANFTGATGVTFVGVAATSVVVVNSTTITCVVPSNPTGFASVIVTTPGGSNGANTYFRYFSPAELSLTGWWRGSYAGAPWAATASAGVSATTGSLVAGVAPSTGTAQNGRTPATMNGTTQYLTNATQLSTLFTAGAGSIVCLYKASVAKAAQGAGSEYLDPYCFGDLGNGGLALTYSSAGFKAVFYDGAYKVATAAQATGAYALATMRWDSANLGLTVNSAAEVTTAAGAFAAAMANSVAMGSSYTNVGLLQGDMLEVLCINSKLSNAQIADIKSYANTRNALSL